jgi:glyoxylase-like metal-dependent hydrolase (beta-lactamase superfamily II)
MHRMSASIRFLRCPALLVGNPFSGQRRSTRLVLAFLLLTVAHGVHAQVVRFERVAEGVYAHIGELGGRTAANQGLNANIGLVLTPGGAVLIDAGATARSAQRVHEAVRQVTSLPVKWVINTAGPDQGLDLGGVTFEFRHRGGAHTSGDMLVWLPQSRVLFSGDVVYVERLLGVIPVSRTLPWLATFAEIERLAPGRIVPGHGRVTDLKTAQADTRDYLTALRSHMKTAVDDGQDISAAVKAFDARRWLHLLNAAELMPGNASRTYLELERE